MIDQTKWNGPGDRPHSYVPDIMAMGDCAVCGHVREAHQIEANRPKRQGELRLDQTVSTAVISPCGKYRYSLFRRWAEGPTCTFIMLNPSTADEQNDDPTIRRCIGFAKREGCGALMVVNMFGYRATDPGDLLLVDDPFGRENAPTLATAIETSNGPVIAAWGAWGPLKQAAKVLADEYPGQLLCLGLTKNGSPRHPLYVKADAPLIPFNPKG